MLREVYGLAELSRSGLRLDRLRAGGRSAEASRFDDVAAPSGLAGMQEGGGDERRRAYALERPAAAAREQHLVELRAGMRAGPPGQEHALALREAGLRLGPQAGRRAGCRPSRSLDEDERHRGQEQGQLEAETGRVRGPLLCRDRGFAGGAQERELFGARRVRRLPGVPEIEGAAIGVVEPHGGDAVGSRRQAGEREGHAPLARGADGVEAVVEEDRDPLGRAGPGRDDAEPVLVRIERGLDRAALAPRSASISVTASAGFLTSSNGTLAARAARTAARSVRCSAWARTIRRPPK